MNKRQSDSFDYYSKDGPYQQKMEKEQEAQCEDIALELKNLKSRISTIANNLGWHYDMNHKSTDIFGNPIAKCLCHQYHEELKELSKS